MCGIVAVLEPAGAACGGLSVTRDRALEMARKVRHRGPDWSGVWCATSAGEGVEDSANKLKAMLLHERLAICGVDSGAQPLVVVDQASGNELAVLCVNGEIYNDLELRKLVPDAKFETESDCEVILHLYLKFGALETVKLLRGMFAFVLFDVVAGTWFAARDHCGIIPLYFGWTYTPATIVIASEMKAMIHTVDEVHTFPPGCLVTSASCALLFAEDQTTSVNLVQSAAIRFYEPLWRVTTPLEISCLDGTDSCRGPPPPLDFVLGQLRSRLTRSVQSHLMGDVPWGVLLSGGLDSSLIASIAASVGQHRVDDEFRGTRPSDPETSARAWYPRIHTFAVGLRGSPDLEAAAAVAKHLGSAHHTVEFTIQEGIDALSDVIYHLESYDVTTVRASVPMFLLARKIKAFGIKLVLSGEGADEIFGGYLYFAKAPSDEEFARESRSKVDQLHLYDCLRANKAMSAWGVEARVPFLDRDFLDWAMDSSNVPIDLKRMGPHAVGVASTCVDARWPIEKWLLRRAFDDGKTLPDSVLWRQKEQFSDGVGYSWIDALKAHAEASVCDDALIHAATTYPIHTPLDKEAYVYRALWEKHFSRPEFAQRFRDSAAQTVSWQKSCACSTETALAWDAKMTADPSGRSVSEIHQRPSEA